MEINSGQIQVVSITIFVVVKLPLVIIVTPNSKRHVILKNQLLKSDKFEVILLKAIMGYDLKSATEFTVKNELALYGRRLTLNERACAISHRKAREIISKFQIGGVILEDDARIIDFDGFEKYVNSFLSRNINKKSILGLERYIENSIEIADHGKQYFIPIFAEIPRAVGYALTKVAAIDLANSSRNYSQVSDWPKSRCRFFVLSRGVIKHGDESSGTVIGDTPKRIFKYTLRNFQYQIIRVFLRKLDWILIREIQG